jgi:hypothetical protein
MLKNKASLFSLWILILLAIILTFFSLNLMGHSANLLGVHKSQSETGDLE